MGERNGRLSAAKLHHSGSIKHFMVKGMEYSLDASDLEDLQPGVCILPQHQAGLKDH